MYYSCCSRKGTVAMVLKKNGSCRISTEYEIQIFGIQLFHVTILFMWSRKGSVAIHIFVYALFQTYHVDLGVSVNPDKNFIIIVDLVAY